MKWNETAMISQGNRNEIGMKQEDVDLATNEIKQMGRNEIDMK